MKRPGANGAVALLAAAIPVMTAGCVDWAGRQDKLIARLEESQEQLRKTTEERNRLQKTVAEQREQIRSLQALGPARLEKLFHVSKIRIGRYTGGADRDGKKDGDEGVKVYLKPIDQYGSAIKAAGEVKIQLFDLAAPPAQNLLGEYTWDPDEMPDRWVGGFMNYQYSFFCPWKSGPPGNGEITVRVEFSDYLTGKRFTDQRLCTVTLGPTTQPGR